MTRKDGIVSAAQAARMRAEVDTKRREIQEGLPHRYGHKWYWWQRAFNESPLLMRLMTCANQVGKSTTHIWDKVERATNIEKWPELWPAAMAKGLTPRSILVFLH